MNIYSLTSYNSFIFPNHLIFEINYCCDSSINSNCIILFPKSLLNDNSLNQNDSESSLNDCYSNRTDSELPVNDNSLNQNNSELSLTEYYSNQYDSGLLLNDCYSSPTELELSSDDFDPIFDFQT
ncbi:hypothetical protein QTN25_000409 [Entamoeba marina]